jgi:hypothetical protein
LGLKQILEARTVILNDSEEKKGAIGKTLLENENEDPFIPVSFL